MKLLTGVLHFIKSKNPPVFHTPMDIRYAIPPTEGQAFLFGRDYDFIERCNLSTVKKITEFDGFCVIQTRNSYYLFTPTGSK